MFPISGKSLLRDADFVTGSQKQGLILINLKSGALVQRQRLFTALFILNVDGTVVADARHGDPLATGKAMRILMELHHQAGTVVLGMGKLGFRPLLVDEAGKFAECPKLALIPGQGMNHQINGLILPRIGTFSLLN